MKKSWIEDMLGFLGVYYEGKKDSGQAQLKKSESQLVEVSGKKSELETSIRTLKNFRNNNFLVSVGLFFLFQMANISFAFMGAAAYFFISNAVLSNTISNKKAKVNEYDKRISNLEKDIEELKKSLNMAEKSAKTNDFIDAEIINVYPNEETSDENNETSEDKKPRVNKAYGESLPEAALAYSKLDEMKEILPIIKNKDYSLYSLFSNVNEAAEKVRLLLQADKVKESKAYLFYNNVETLHKWADGIRDLYDADVYDSLLINIKNQAVAALPVLQEKINKDYYRIVYPDIMDIEAEMTVMSKENGV